MTRFNVHHANRLGLSRFDSRNVLAIAGLFILIASLHTNSANAQKNKSDDAAAATAEDLESFDVVWKTIKETHWDLDEDAWDKSRDELRKKAEALSLIHI